MMETIWELLLHCDRHLSALAQGLGPWTYLVLFLVIFAETGLIVTPFLPGDSLLFAAGALAARGMLDLWWLIAALAVAGIAGDGVNYAAGRFFGERILRKAVGRFVKEEHLQRTHRFYEEYGGKTIVLARFVPIVRTFAPFVAGIGGMRYATFAAYNIAGGLLWVGSLVLAGYAFGGIPIVRDNFSAVVLAIVGISLLPGIIEYVRHRMRGSAPSAANAPGELPEKTGPAGEAGA